MKKNTNETNALISVIILTYRNYRYIYETMDSVFKQTYPNIELIISDDGSPVFPFEEVNEYIQKNKPDNVKAVKINCEKENRGTVKHINKALTLTNGKYISLLACDDVFYDENVLANYVNNFEASDKEYLIQMAQTAMYDETLSNLLYFYCRPDVEKLLRENDSTRLHESICLFPGLPSTSTCFTRKFFEKKGFFDENYKLIEDSPLHIKLAREKCPILYNNFAAIKHREGGISHGASNVPSATVLKYYADIINIHKKEILPYLHLMDKEMRDLVRDKVKSENLWIEHMLYRYGKSKTEYVGFLLRHPFFTLKKVLQKFYYRFFSRTLKLVYIGAVLLMLIPLSVDLLAPISTWINVDNFITFMLGVSIALLGGGLVSTTLCWLGMVIDKLEQFPLRCLHLE